PLLVHCDVQGWTGALGGSGNLGGNPHFIDDIGADNLAGTLDDNLTPVQDSPAIDSGDNAWVLPGDLSLDLAGNPRFFDVPCAPNTGSGSSPLIDMGAYEAQSVCVSGVPGGGLESAFRLTPLANPVRSGRALFRFTLPAAGSVSLELFDVSGRLVN